jgi:hypothetical protein
MGLFQNMGFDPIAFATALIAILYTAREAKRNNAVLLNIRECSNTGRSSRDENNNQLFDHLSILVRNIGISIHSPEMTLVFQGRDGFGRMEVRLERRRGKSDHDELSKGMIAWFGFKSYELDKVGAGMLMELEDPAKQYAHLHVYSQDYLAKAFRIGGKRDRLASKWNWFAYRVNKLFDREVEVKGRKGVKPGRLLPTMRTLDFPIMGFIKSIPREWGST